MRQRLEFWDLGEFEKNFDVKLPVREASATDGTLSVGDTGQKAMIDAVN